MISNRLKCIVEFLDNDHDIADIGSDHGLLLILLNEKNFTKNALGVENKIGPYKNLEKTIKTINKPNFKSSLSSGLEKVPANYETIVIAGMGFTNIKEIVLKDREKGNIRNTFVIDCHTNQELVRSFFYRLGYKINDETVLYEDDIYYEIIKFTLNVDKAKYTDEELKYGPLNLKRKTETFLNMCKDKIYKLSNILNKISSDNEKYKLIKTEISFLKEIVHEN